MAKPEPVDPDEWRHKAKARPWNETTEDGYLGALQAHRTGLPSKVEQPNTLTGTMDPRDLIDQRARDTIDWILAPGIARWQANARIGTVRAAIDPKGTRFGNLTNAQLLESLQEIAYDYARDSVERVYKTEGYERTQPQGMWVVDDGARYTGDHGDTSDAHSTGTATSGSTGTEPPT